MHWTDDALVLGARRHGEAGVVLELLTRAHGRHLGLVHGGRSSRLQPVLQPGNSVQATWRARLDEQLGTFTVEPLASRAARLIASPLALAGIATLAGLVRHLPERDPHPDLFEMAQALADHLDEPDLAGPLFVRFELALLADLGFGLDLTACAATGATRDLTYVSPKSGRAVSAGAGEPYRDRLLPLPGFLVGQPRGNRPSADEIGQGFALTGYFLDRWVLDPLGQRLPDERARFVARAVAAAE
jgi:DNA repair protein RecO (recombination protein O)